NNACKSGPGYAHLSIDSKKIHLVKPFIYFY
ncbi:MAG: hypothetical protein ACI9G5_001850, partial [Paracoccaceae bacterium]